MATGMNKIFEQVSAAVIKVSEKNPYYTLGAFLLVVFLLDYFLVMQFQLRTLYHLSPKASTLAAEVRQTRQDIARIPQYQNEIRQLDQKARALNSKIRTREQIPLIIDSIMRLARKNGLRIEQIMPNSALSEPILRDNEGQYFSIPLVVDARGGYHNFGRFLNQMEHEEAFLSVGDFKIEPNPTDATHHDIKVTLDAVVFEAKGQ